MVVIVVDNGISYTSDGFIVHNSWLTEKGEEEE